MVYNPFLLEGYYERGRKLKDVTKNLPLQRDVATCEPRLWNISSLAEQITCTLSAVSHSLILTFIIFGQAVWIRATPLWCGFHAIGLDDSDKFILD